MKRKINCIAVDDEPLSLEQITGYINKIDFLNLKQSFDNGIDALNYLHSNEIDLVFLDIMMDELSGIDIIESLNNKPHFIFTTAYDQYALRAFDLQATDYLQKPISFKRFMKSVNKVFKDIFSIHPEASNTIVNKESRTQKDFIFIKTKYKMQKLDFSDIYYIKGLNNYLIIKTKEETLYTIQSFSHILKVLPGENFIRIHKSYIVAIDKINIIGKNQLTVNNDNIPIGETYKEYFFNFLKKKGLMFFNNSKSNLYSHNN